MKNYWTKQAEQMLVGKVIKSVRFMTKKEIEMNGWYNSTIVITLDDGVEIYPSQDEEGNDVGVLCLTHKNQFGLIPKLTGDEI
jgi:hypothetical protein